MADATNDVRTSQARINASTSRQNHVHILELAGQSIQYLLHNRNKQNVRFSNDVSILLHTVFILYLARRNKLFIYTYPWHCNPTIMGRLPSIPWCYTLLLIAAAPFKRTFVNYLKPWWYLSMHCMYKNTIIVRFVVYMRLRSRLRTQNCVIKFILTFHPQPLMLCTLYVNKYLT